VLPPFGKFACSLNLKMSYVKCAGAWPYCYFVLLSTYALLPQSADVQLDGLATCLQLIIAAASYLEAVILPQWAILGYA
jgi:hypothetical protein